MYLLNIFHSGGVWILPVLVYGASAHLFMMAYKASKSGSLTGGGNGKPLVESDQNVPIYRTWPFAWASVLFVVATIMLFMIATDYKGV